MIEFAAVGSIMLGVNQRVRIKRERWAFGGVKGVIANAPDCMAQLDPEPWMGPFQHKTRADGRVILYWVIFDEPTDDGSGDGPYTGAAIEQDFLEAM